MSSSSSAKKELPGRQSGVLLVSCTWLLFVQSLFLKASLGELCDDLHVSENLVLLRYHVQARVSACPPPPAPAPSQLTSSPTLTPTPPKPGSITRSPSLTEMGTILPSRPGAPGPTARTMPSGGGVELPAEGRNSPEAVFCEWLGQWRHRAVCECNTPRQPLPAGRGLGRGEERAI
jgi:hypothetical protein